MAWLVTGGAGYIGSHVVRAFADQRVDCVVLDNLSSGHREFLDTHVPFVEGDLLDSDAVQRCFADHDIDGVMHIAGFKYAGVSVLRPLHTYQQNVTAMTNLLDVMREAGVARMVFSSSASVYGTPTTDVVTEESPLAPESPYGETKLIGEWLLRDRARAAALTGEQFSCTALRYFNVVGSGHVDRTDTSPHNLFPMVFDRLLTGQTPAIFGTDYPTPDGTCVRDYVHVQDLAVSHVTAAEALMAGRDLLPAYNLGSGTGASVREIMTAMAEVTGIEFAPELRDRRPGDPARIVADGTLAGRDLAWEMRHDITSMVRTAWEAHSAWHDLQAAATR